MLQQWDRGESHSSHHNTIAALKKDASIRALNFNSIIKKVEQLKSIGWAMDGVIQNIVVVYAKKWVEQALAKFWLRSRQESRRVFGWRDCRDLGEIAVRPPRLSGQKLAEILPEISPRSQNLTEILAEILTKISAAKNLPRFSPRFSLRFSLRSWGGLKISAAKSLLRILARFQVRSRWDSHQDINILEVKKTLLRNWTVVSNIAKTFYT